MIRHKPHINSFTGRMLCPTREEENVMWWRGAHIAKSVIYLVDSVRRSCHCHYEHGHNTFRSNAYSSVDVLTVSHSHPAFHCRAEYNELAHRRLFHSIKFAVRIFASKKKRYAAIRHSSAIIANKIIIMIPKKNTLIMHEILRGKQTRWDIYGIYFNCTNSTSNNRI